MPDESPILVIDANVVVRAVADETGSQAEILRLAPHRLRLAIAPLILAEYAAVADRRKVKALFRRRGVTVSEFDAFIARLTDIALAVEPTGDPPPCRDEKDRPYLHCAVETRADFIVTHDKDLLVQEKIGSTRIVDPWTFLAWFRAQP